MRLPPPFFLSDLRTILRTKWRASVVAGITIGAVALSAHPSFAAESTTAPGSVTPFATLSNTVEHTSDVLALATDIGNWAATHGINASNSAFHVSELRVSSGRPVNSDVDNIASAYQDALASALTPANFGSGTALYNAVAGLAAAHPQALTDLRSLAESPITHAYAVSSVQQLVGTDRMPTTMLLSSQGVNLGYAPLVFSDDPSGLLGKLSLMLGSFSTASVPCDDPDCYRMPAEAAGQALQAFLDFLHYEWLQNLPSCFNTANTTWGSGGLYGIVVHGTSQVSCSTQEPTYFDVFATLYWVNSPYGPNGYNIGTSNSCPQQNYCSATIDSNIAPIGTETLWQTLSEFDKGNDSTVVPYPAYSVITPVY